MAAPADLKKLKDLGDFTVAAGDPDPRGWDVRSTDGRDIGRVSDLVVDTAAMKARYLDVEVDRGVDRSTSERHLLVPTESVAIGAREREERRISVPLTAEAAMRAAGAADPTLAGSSPSAGEWPTAAHDGCNVRFTRGGRNG